MRLAVYYYVATLKIRVGTPSPYKTLSITFRVRVKISDLHGPERIRHVDYAQSAGIVRGKNVVAPDVQVMVGRLCWTKVLLVHQRIVKLLHIPDDHTCIVKYVLNLVKLIIHNKIRLIFGQPTLMRIVYIRISRKADLLGVGLIGDIRNAEPGFIRSKTDLPALIF